MDAQNTKNAAPQPPQSIGAMLRSEKVRNVLYQVIAVLAVFGVAFYLISNTLTNLEQQNISTGFGYLDREASFGISESMIDYDPSDTYLKALQVGFLNTFKVALSGIVLATIVGTIVGISMLSSNFLVRKIASAYVELFRNIPVLLQLIFWWTLFNTTLPSPRQAINPFGDFYLSNRGFFMPWLEWHPGLMIALIGLVIGAIATVFMTKWARKRQAATGQPFPALWAGLGLIFGCGLIGYVLGGAPSTISYPALQGFNFRGGFRMSPEFAAMLLGLTVYTSTYIADIVRSGIMAVPKGQWEAAESLGIKRSWTLRFIILPQSMRVAIPPLTSQYLNLTKNSSLAIAIGYPDLVSISNTTMNQTGQAIEAIATFMTVYLTLSLLTSLFMNWFNAKMALVER